MLRGERDQNLNSAAVQGREASGDLALTSCDSVPDSLAHLGKAVLLNRIALDALVQLLSMLLLTQLTQNNFVSSIRKPTKTGL